jgi:hypothetical protein
MKTLENPGDAVSKTKSSFTFTLLFHNAEHRHLSFSAKCAFSRRPSEFRESGQFFGGNAEKRAQEQ